MFFNTRYTMVKIISVVVCGCFFWQQVVWAQGPRLSAIDHLRPGQFRQAGAAGANLTGEVEQQAQQAQELADIVHDIVIQLEPIQGWLERIGENPVKHNVRLRSAYTRFYRLDKQRKNWLASHNLVSPADNDAVIEYYLQRGAEDKDYQAIIETGKAYLQEIQAALTTLKHSPYMDRQALAELLVKAKVMVIHDPKKKTVKAVDHDTAKHLADEIIQVFSYQIDNGMRFLDDYLRTKSAPEQIRVYSELEDILTSYHISEQRLIGHASRSVKFTFKTEGVTDAAHNAEVYMNRPDFQRLVRNLIENALDAMPVDQPAPEVIVKLSADGENVNISIKDNGSGIDPLVRDRVEQFIGATTKQPHQKEATKGRGLILAKKVAQEANGDIIIQGLLDHHGTIVQVTLLRSKEQPKEEEAEKPAIGFRHIMSDIWSWLKDNKAYIFGGGIGIFGGAGIILVTVYHLWRGWLFVLPVLVLFADFIQRRASYQRIAQSAPMMRTWAARKASLSKSKSMLIGSLIMLTATSISGILGLKHHQKKVETRIARQETQKRQRLEEQIRTLMEKKQIVIRERLDRLASVATETPDINRVIRLLLRRTTPFDYRSNAYSTTAGG